MKNIRAQEDQARATKYPSLPNSKPHNTVKIILEEAHKQKHSHYLHGQNYIVKFPYLQNYISTRVES